MARRSRNANHQFSDHRGTFFQNVHCCRARVVMRRLSLQGRRLTACGHKMSAPGTVLSGLAALRISSAVVWILLVLFVQTVLLSGSCDAAEQRGTEMERASDAAAATMALSVRDCIRLALRNNLDIAIKQLDPPIRDAQVSEGEGLFDPIFFAAATFTDVKQPLPISIPAGVRAALGDSIEVRIFSLNAGLGGLLVTGGNYSLQFSETRSDSTLTRLVFPFVIGETAWEYDMSTSFSLTQPLLRNFGVGVSTTPIRVAKNNKDMSLHEFRRQVIQTVGDVQNTYWDLSFAIENHEVQEQSLRLAEDLLEQNRVRAEVGVMAPLDVLQAEAGVAAREEAVILARSNVERQEDRLIKLLNVAGGAAGWNVKILPTDEPTATALQFDEAESVDIALRNRPDLALQRELMENSELNVKYTKNQLLPKLDITGRYEFEGLDVRYYDAFDDMMSEGHPTWSLGLNLEFPLGNRVAKGNHIKARLEKKQLETTIRKTTHDVNVQVRDAIRRIATDLKRIEVTRIARELASEALEAEEKKLEVGISTSHDVLRFQEDLTRARSNELRAVIDYNKSLVRLYQAMSTTLEQYGIVVDQ